MEEKTFSTDDDSCVMCLSQMRIDSHSHSETVICGDCGLYALAIDWPNQRVVIPLPWLSRPWERRPGDSDITEAENLVDDLLWHTSPNPLTRLRYGISSAQHLESLQWAVSQGVTAYDLNRVRCDGLAITRLVWSVPKPGPCADFVTWFDEMEAANK